MSAKTIGVSRRTYARMRGVSEAAIRKHLTNGNLAGALLPDGTLDPLEADRLLASSATHGAAEPVALRTAKVRRMRAQVRKLNDQVEEIRRNLIMADDVDEVFGARHRLIAGHIRALAERAAPVVAGMNAQAAHLALRDAIYDVLGAVSSEAASALALLEEATESEGELQLDALDYPSLLAMRTDLQATKLELERALAKGVLRRVQDLGDDYEEKVQILKSLLLALPGRPLVAAPAASFKGALIALQYHRQAEEGRSGYSPAWRGAQANRPVLAAAHLWVRRCCGQDQRRGVAS